MQNDTEAIKETSCVHEANELLKQGWKLLQIGERETLHTRRAAGGYSVQTKLKEGFVYCLGLDKEQRIINRHIQESANPAASEIHILRDEKREGESGKIITGIQLWTTRKPDGSVELDLNGRKRIKLSRADAVHLAKLLSGSHP